MWTQLNLPIRPLYLLLGLVGLFVVLVVLRIVTKKRFLNLLIALPVVAAIALLTTPLWLGGPPASPLAGGVVVTVERGDVAEVVEATGNLAPVSQATLSFSTAGRLVELRVATGDTVRAGQVVALLDTTDLELQLAQAQASVNVAEANLNKLLATAREEDVAVARNSVSQARAALDEQSVTLSAATEQARLSWIEAANNLRDAQANYSNIYWDNRNLEDKLAQVGKELPQDNVDAEARAWRAVENAEAAMEQARLAYEAARQRQESALRTARAQLSSAQANLERLIAGATDADIAAAQAAVEQARASYNLARAQLDKATLKAPFAGVVATVLADEQDQVTMGTPILVLFDPTAYLVDVEVDEVDIPKVQVGQAVSVTLDALPEVELPGQVSEIALSPSPSAGVVTYRVRVQITDLRGVPVRAGMTANASIVTRQALGVLVIPRRAVRIIEGQAVVEKVLPGDQLQPVTVTLGLQAPNFVEVVAGLQEGEKVFVRGVVQKNQLQQIIEDASSGQSMPFRTGQ